MDGFIDDRIMIPRFDNRLLSNRLRSLLKEVYDLREL